MQGGQDTRLRSDAPAKDLYASLLGTVYSTYMERRPLGRFVSRAVWGGGAKPYYESMSVLGEVPDGGTIVDCPCGAGPALRGLSAQQNVRYVGVDLSPAMLRRAERRAQVRGLSGLEFLEADATDLPLASGSVDLFLSFWGLHCFPDPKGAIDEAARLLAPGGRLLGASIVRGTDSLRQRLLIRPGHGAFGQVPSAAEIEEWLQRNDLEIDSIRKSGTMLYFDARASS